MTGPDPTAAPAETVAWIRKQMLDTLQSATHEFVTAMRAEGVSDETAARVLNRVTTGVPDPDPVIVSVRPSYPTFGQGTMRPQAGG